MSGPFHLRVPASTSNLGPGFDCLGLAVDLHFELSWDPSGAGTVCEGRRPPKGFGDLLARSRTELGLPVRGALRIRSEIPVGRGLGSSAALRVALAALRAHLAERSPGRAELLAAVAEAEGHPDNVAPALLGGLVVARLTPEGVDAVPLPFSERIGIAFAAPSTPISTAAARAALPETVPSAVAWRTAGRLARLIPALASGDGAGIAAGLIDEIHLPARLPLIPGGRRALDAALEAGAWGCTISGAGSGLIALGPRERISAVRDAMAAVFRAGEEGDSGAGEPPAFSLRPELTGAVWGGDPAVLRSPVSPAPAPVDEPGLRRG